MYLVVHARNDLPDKISFFVIQMTLFDSQPRVGRVNRQLPQMIAQDASRVANVGERSIVGGGGGVVDSVY